MISYELPGCTKSDGLFRCAGAKFTLTSFVAKLQTVDIVRHNANALYAFTSSDARFQTAYLTCHTTGRTLFGGRGYNSTADSTLRGVRGYNNTADRTLCGIRRSDNTANRIRYVGRSGFANYTDNTAASNDT